MNKAINKKKVKAPAGAKNPIIIQTIETRPVNRTPQDIPKWRNAIQNAESRIPRRNLLYDLYADVIQDGHVLAVTSKRIDATTTANWQFVNKKGEPVDAVNELIDTIGFDDIITEIMNSKFWGYSILEPTFYKTFDEKWQIAANLLPRLNYRPETGIVAFDYMSDDGVHIREGIHTKRVMEVGDVKDLGLFESAAQYAILKRGGVGDYAMYVQVFGRPILDAVWDGFDEKQKLQLKEALDIGAGGQIIRPLGTEISIIESKTTNTTIHPDFLKFLNKELSKCLLGTTETVESSDSSGYSQSKTHSDQDNNKHESDINFVRKVLNSRFIRILEAHGFNTEGGAFIIQGEETKLTTKESFEMHKSMANDLGIPLTDDFWYETYGVPKPENYEELKNAKLEATKIGETQNKVPGKKQSEKKAGEPTNKEDPTEEKEVNLVLNGWQKFMKLFLTAPAETTGAICGSHHTIKLAFEDTFNEADFIKRMYDTKGKATFDFGLFSHTATTLLKGFKKGWNKDFIALNYAPSFKYGIDDPALLTAFEQNIFKFAGAKTLAEAQLLNELFRKSKSFNEFFQLAKGQVTIFNKDWLLTEYNTAVLTAESAATYHRLMGQVDIFPYWKYTTAGDERVRHTHLLLEGIILPANDPRWAKLFPPNGWNCRCYIVPRLRHEFDATKLAADRAKADAYLQSPAFAKEAAQGWGVNRGAVGEIFTANQQYAHKFPNMASKLLNKLGASDFDLQQYSTVKKTATDTMPTMKTTAETFYKELEVFNEKPIVRDYNKRPLQIEKKNFERHTVGKKQDRIQLLSGMQEALNTPDEVWLNGKKLEDLVYVKYYKDQTLITVADVSKGNLKLSTWFSLKESKNVITKYRRGLLVYSKK
jgi:SPP1 gp7 family putative phage head morphogenesis protein